MPLGPDIVMSQQESLLKNPGDSLLSGFPFYNKNSIFTFSILYIRYEYF